MANIVAHVVSVSGPPEGVAAFKRRALSGQGRAQTFDFDALVPMPAIVKGTGGSSEVTEGLIILGEDDVPDQFGTTAGGQVGVMLDFPWVREAGVVDRAGLVELLRQRAQKAGRLNASLEGARRAVQAWRETGHASQASWATRHWGVRGAPESFGIVKDEPGLLAFEFTTAWATPERIWDRLAAAFPDLTIAVAGFEEAWHFAVAGEIRDGENRVKEVEPTRELYERVFGEPYEDDEEDAGRPSSSAYDAAIQARLDAPVPKRPTPLSEQTGWRKYKWDLLGWLIGAIILLVYFLWW